MARRTRAEIEGRLYHVITRVNNRRQIFNAPAAAADLKLIYAAATEAEAEQRLADYSLVYDETFDAVSYVGLLTTATDARGITAQFRYDNLNRLSQVNYSDDTRTVSNYYDQPATNYFNNCRLTEASTAPVESIPATSQSYKYDLMGRVKSNQQTVGNQSYSMWYEYNLGGLLISEHYPSGRSVNFEFDNGGRLSQVNSGSTVYANQFDYSTTQGLLKSVTLGNGAIESYGYNSRLQLKSLDLSRNGTQIQHYDYRYGVYDPATGALDESKNTGQRDRNRGQAFDSSILLASKLYPISH